MKKFQFSSFCFFKIAARARSRPKKTRFELNQIFLKSFLEQIKIFSGLKKFLKILFDSKNIFSISINRKILEIVFQFQLKYIFTFKFALSLFTQKNPSKAFYLFLNHTLPDNSQNLPSFNFQQSLFLFIHFSQKIKKFSFLLHITHDREHQIMMSSPRRME